MQDESRIARPEDLPDAAKLLRYYSLLSTTEAGSGHPTSCLSSADIMAALFFGGIFTADLHNPLNPNNDRLIFSKGHAAPLLYSLYAVAGVISENELRTLRKFGSQLEGHPTMRFPYTEAATGSLGQGLSIGVGMALAGKRLDNLDYKVYVLLGDSEMAEGSNWEAIQLATHYELSNLVGIIDLNGLGQRGETMFGHDAQALANRVASFGWTTEIVDGHDVLACRDALSRCKSSTRPTMIIAKTDKGHGVSFLQGADGWHGRALKPDEYEKAIEELEPIKRGTFFQPPVPVPAYPTMLQAQPQPVFSYQLDTKVSTRKAYGNALVRLSGNDRNMVVLDAEVSNSTFAADFKAVRPERFFEMYIAEQNMVGTAIGLARRGKKPFISTFAAFLSRAYDQFRMAQYSDVTMVVAGSHAGVSIGPDGSSQMGLEDVAFFRTLMNSAVLYPSDAVSCERAVEEASRRRGITYIRTTRADLPVIYQSDERFPVGGLKIIRQDENDDTLIIAAGITLHEALAAHEELKSEGVMTRVIDLYSVKPIDSETLIKQAHKVKRVITVEDHYEAGGIGEAVAAVLAGDASAAPLTRLCVRHMPMSGKPEELLEAQGISKKAIVETIKSLSKSK